MTTFKLDTSGVVATPNYSEGEYAQWPHDGMTWANLSPFVQGYVEAMLQEFNKKRFGDFPVYKAHLIVFRDLAPETLARIMEDCERFQKPPSDWVVFNLETGRDFWRDRQGRQLTRLSSKLFPPLTLYLADDGKLHFRD